jgi:hypothetical protein
MRMKFGNEIGYGVMEDIDKMERENEKYPEALRYHVRKRVIEMARRLGAKKVGAFSIHRGAQVIVEYVTDLEMVENGI